MICVNEARILGSLGKDPELRHTSSGIACCTFDVGTTKSLKQQDGSWKNSTEWHRVVTWRKQAEYCAKHLLKRSRVYIEGEMTKRSYEKDGRKQYISEVVAHKVIPLGDQKGSGSIEFDPTPTESRNDDSASAFDGEIPF